MDKDREAAKEEVDWMIGDLEAGGAPQWAIDLLRDSLGDLDGLDTFEQWGEACGRGFREIIANLEKRAAAIIAAGGRRPTEHDKPSDLEREADRLAAGKLQRELTPEQRAHQVQLLRDSAQLARDRATLSAIIARANEVVALHAEEADDSVERRKAAMREAVREEGHGSTVWRINQARHKESGRERGGKK